MISVILTHINLIPGMQYLQAFMLPLFALLSGYLLPSSIPSWSSILTKKGLHLLTPYFLIGLISLLYWRLFLQNLPVFHEFFQPTSELVLALLTGHDLVFNGPLWYLFELFLAFLWWRMTAGANRYTVGLGLIFLFSKYIISRLLDGQRMFAPLPLSLYLVGYLHLGSFLKTKQAFLMRIPVWMTAIIFFVVVSFNGAVNLYALTLNNIFLFLIGSISGSLIVINLSMTLEKYLHIPVVRLCSYCGEHSLALLTWHWPLLLTLNALLSIYGIFALFGGTSSLVHYNLPPHKDPLSLFIRFIFLILYLSWAVFGPLIIDFILNKRKHLIRI